MENAAKRPPVQYLVGTPEGRSTRLEKKFAEQPWVQAREKCISAPGPRQRIVRVVEDEDRVHQRTAIRQKRLRRYWDRLVELRKMKELTRDDLLKKWEQPSRCRTSARLGPSAGSCRGSGRDRETFTFKLLAPNYGNGARRGRYLLRSNLPRQQCAQLWELYLMLRRNSRLPLQASRGDLRIALSSTAKRAGSRRTSSVAFLSYPA